jgi:hypothetical protein
MVAGLALTFIVGFCTTVNPTVFCAGHPALLRPETVYVVETDGETAAVEAVMLPGLKV